METKETEHEKEFVKLLVAHQALIQSFVVSLLPGCPDADDVVQITNEVLWTKRGEFELGTNFKAWVLTTARFQVMAMQQKLRRKHQRVLAEDVSQMIFEEVKENDPTEMRRNLKYLNDCVCLLQIEDQKLVLHRYWKESGLEEYARATQRSVEALRSSLYRIRASLRKCIKAKIKQKGEGYEPV